MSVSVFGLLNALLREITNVKSEQFVPHKEWGQILNKSLGHLHLCTCILKKKISMITFSSCTENNPDQKFKGTLPEKQKGKKIYMYISYR